MMLKRFGSKAKIASLENLPQCHFILWIEINDVLCDIHSFIDFSRSCSEHLHRLRNVVSDILLGNRNNARVVQKSTCVFGIKKPEGHASVKLGLDRPGVEGGFGIVGQKSFE